MDSFSIPVSFAPFPGISLPADLEIEFQTTIEPKMATLGRELTPREMEALFRMEYLASAPYQLTKMDLSEGTGKGLHWMVSVIRNEAPMQICTEGSSKKDPVDALMMILNKIGVARNACWHYEQATLPENAGGQIITFVRLVTPHEGKYWGVGADKGAQASVIRGMLSAVNRREKIIA